MKIRIKGASVRIRLSRTEVARLLHEGGLREVTPFLSSTFTYAVEKTIEGTALSADFEEGMITMYVPQMLVQDWDTNSLISIEAMMPMGESGSLHLLLEKDFQCIDQSVEDQSDNYVNPNQNC